MEVFEERTIGMLAAWSSQGWHSTLLKWEICEELKAFMDNTEVEMFIKWKKWESSHSKGRVPSRLPMTLWCLGVFIYQSKVWHWTKADSIGCFCDLVLSEQWGLQGVGPQTLGIVLTLLLLPPLSPQRHRSAWGHPVLLPLSETLALWWNRSENHSVTFFVLFCDSQLVVEFFATCLACFWLLTSHY
jgi:hypothetical protein